MTAFFIFELGKDAEAMARQTALRAQTINSEIKTASLISKLEKDAEAMARNMERENNIYMQRHYNRRNMKPRG